MLAAQPVQESIVQAVVEDKNAIRIGISIDTDASMNVNALLAMMSRELSTNPHQIAGVLAMQQNDETRMQIYQLGGGTIRDAMHLQWNEIHGREPLGQALDWFYEELKGRRHTTSP
jgi:hypothetical protein